MGLTPPPADQTDHVRLNTLNTLHGLHTLMNALLIDPEHHTISTVMLPDDGNVHEIYEAIVGALRTDTCMVAMRLDHPSGGSDLVLCDDYDERDPAAVS